MTASCELPPTIAPGQSQTSPSFNDHIAASTLATTLVPFATTELNPAVRMSAPLPPKEADLAKSKMSEAAINQADANRGAVVHVSSTDSDISS